MRPCLDNKAMDARSVVVLVRLGGGGGGWLSAESESAIVEDSVQARRGAWVAQETTGVFWVS